jgi:imidazolonepropionase-like amidohydrolase
MYRLAVVICLFGVAAPLQAAPQDTARAASQRQPALGSFAIEHVTVINVAAGTRSPDQTVVVTGNRIAAVGSSVSFKTPAGARTVDGRGKFLVPGFWDMHVHAFYSIPARTLPYFAARGMTGVREMGGSIVELSDARQLIDNGLVAPRFVSPGPLLIGAPLRPDFSPGTGIVVSTPEEGRQVVDRLLAQRVDFIKMQGQLPRQIAIAIADEAKLWHVPFVGHLPLDMDIVEASGLGFRSIEHLAALAPVCAEDPGALRPAGPNTPAPSTPIAINRAKCEAALQHVAKNGTWFCPMISQVAGVTRTRQFNMAILQMAIKAGVKILAGTDAPGVLFWKGDYSIADRVVQDELALLVEAGLTPVQALQTATVNPAVFLNMADQLGAVDAGKLADLVLLNADPLVDVANTRKVDAVVLGGRLIDSVQRQKLIDDELATQRATAKKN